MSGTSAFRANPAHEILLLKGPAPVLLGLSQAAHPKPASSYCWPSTDTGRGGDISSRYLLWVIVVFLSEGHLVGEASLAQEPWTVPLWWQVIPFLCGF